MSKSLVLLFFIGCMTPGDCQTFQSNRCDVKRVEDTGHFERWLKGRQASSARKKTSVYRIPVVIHVLHSGEPVGEGFNHSNERIQSQIRVLNEDFRRKAGTPGFNTHPDGGDAMIEFVLAKIDPDGKPTDGIVRVDITSVEAPPINGNLILLCSKYSYWNPEHYLNIWSLDLGIPPSTLLGEARFPVSDLDGLPDGDRDLDADGIFINAPNFGIGENNESNFNMGRTLTHEMGHFLGLLHIWGSNNNNCEGYGDYCDDTPPVSNFTAGCPAQKPLACNGGVAMIENYMDWSHDACMNIFTNDQISRMHTVLENSVRRKSLVTSPALRDPVTGLPDDVESVYVNVFPNPATDKINIVLKEYDNDEKIKLAAYDLSGKKLFSGIFDSGRDIEIETTDFRNKMIVLEIRRAEMLWKKLVLIK